MGERGGGWRGFNSESHNQSQKYGMGNREKIAGVKLMRGILRILKATANSNFYVVLRRPTVRRSIPHLQAPNLVADDAIFVPCIYLDCHKNFVFLSEKEDQIEGIASVSLEQDELRSTMNFIYLIWDSGKMYATMPCSALKLCINVHTRCGMPARTTVINWSQYKGTAHLSA